MSNIRREWVERSPVTRLFAAIVTTFLFAALGLSAGSRVFGNEWLVTILGPLGVGILAAFVGIMTYTGGFE